MGSSGVVDFDNPRETRRRWYSEAFLAHPLQMKLNGFLDKALHFVSGVADGNHAG
jgi:hypothetical protein